MQRNSIKTVHIILVLFFLVSSFRYEVLAQSVTQEKDAYVILLHGLGQSKRSMEKIGKSLSSHGYKVVNVGYPSTKYPIEYLADDILNNIVERYSENPQSKIHFVTHSMGGIVVRYYLKKHKLRNLGRIVMISPPNQGSELVDSLGDSYFFNKLNGPAGRQLGTDKQSVPLSLGSVDFELGVIAGNRSFNPLYSLIVPGPDDGVVSVERTKVAGMKDFLLLPQTHAFIMKSEDVIQQVIYFLEHGVFKKGEQ
ncbi:MAG: alpha/beta fold hydrolase [Candidatus Aminicenantes bacterium]|nr:MAG: alpha/beta fold hydrolase [Candidatus Aminicenantes bacterium]